MGEALTGAEKAAILITLLGEEAASCVLQNLETQEVREITLEIARIDKLEPNEFESVLEEFQTLIERSRTVELAGPGLAKRLLSRARPGEAEKLLTELEPGRPLDGEEVLPDIPRPELPESLVVAPFRRLATLLQEEPPQTVALVLSHLPPKKASRILGLFERSAQIDLTQRMAAIHEVRPDVVTRVGRVLEEKLQALCEEPLFPLNGIQSAADTLIGLGRATGQEIIDELGDSEPELAEELRNFLFTFEMLGALTDKDCQEVLKQVERGTLALALKGADPDLQVLFYRNMSERAAQMLKEELDFLGSPKLSEIEASQRSIIEMVLKLEKEGVISLEEEAVA